MTVQLQDREDAQAVRPKKVLLVEDDRPIRALVTLILSREPLRLEEAVNGLDTLQRVRSERFDLIVLDLLLPGIDGFEILRRIRSDSENLDTPVLVLTALSQGDDVLRGYSLGATRYMHKPFEPAELVDEVRRLCGIDRSPQRDYPPEIRRVDCGDVVTLEIRGALDLITSDSVRRGLRERLAGQERRVIIDVSRVTFLDSAGIGVLLETWRDLGHAGRPLLIVGASARIRRVFHVVGLDAVLA